MVGRETNIQTNKCLQNWKILSQSQELDVHLCKIVAANEKIEFAIFIALAPAPTSFV